LSTGTFIETDSIFVKETRYERLNPYGLADSLS